MVCTNIIKLNSIVTMQCKLGRTETREKYWVLTIFSKSYNKRYIERDNDCVLFQQGSKKCKKIKLRIKLQQTIFELECSRHVLLYFPPE